MAAATIGCAGHEPVLFIATTDRTCLLCLEQNPADCHRTLAAELDAARSNDRPIASHL